MMRHVFKLSGIEGCLMARVCCVFIACANTVLLWFELKIAILSFAIYGIQVSDTPTYLTSLACVHIGKLCM